MTTPYAYDDTYFRATFPAFANTTTYPTGMLSGYWTLAESGFMPGTDQWMLNGTPLITALNLLTAHFAQSYTLINSVQNNVIVTGATEGTVTVSMLPPPTKTGYQWWLATTQYGQQLWALLQIQSIGGAYVGGSCEIGSFRKAGGYF